MPTNGLNVVGMQLDGCKWNYQRNCLDESDPLIHYVGMPPIKFYCDEDNKEDQGKFYDCPVFKTNKFRGKDSHTQRL